MLRLAGSVLSFLGCDLMELSRRTQAACENDVFTVI